MMGFLTVQAVSVKILKWHSKPSEELKDKFGYRKWKLPEYADELDFDKLKKNCDC